MSNQHGSDNKNLARGIVHFHLGLGRADSARSGGQGEGDQNTNSYSGEKQHRPEVNFKCAITWKTGNGDFLGKRYWRLFGNLLDPH